MARRKRTRPPAPAPGKAGDLREDLRIAQGAFEKTSGPQAGEAEQGGVTPLDFLLKTMRDESEPMWLRCLCAKAAAPYVHPKLAQITHAIGMQTSIVITGGLPPEGFSKDGDQSVLDLDGFGKTGPQP